MGSRQEARRLVAGMVGGGDGADIGKTHRHAMRLDDQYELAAGVFGQDVQSGDPHGTEPGRTGGPRIPGLPADGRA